MTPPTKPLNLGELIDALSECGAESVRIAAPMRLTPTTVDSYRGYYEDLAISYDAERFRPEMPLAAFLATLRSAVGATFTGHKGGQFTMDRDSVVWLSCRGDNSGTRIIGIDVEDDVAYLLLTHRRWK